MYVIVNIIVSSCHLIQCNRNLVKFIMRHRFIKNF